jgi:hypothetical protein
MMGDNVTDAEQQAKRSPKNYCYLRTSSVSTGHPSQAKWRSDALSQCAKVCDKSIASIHLRLEDSKQCPRYQKAQSSQ